MKTKKVIALLLLGTLYASAQTEVWQTRMIQSQIGGATGIPELVQDRGSRPSLPIGENGSRFELWGWRFVDGRLASEELLDSTEVGAYRPTAEIFITSNDPFDRFHRSRVDQPFQVKFDVKNLVDASVPNTPVAATKVEVEHWVDLYTEGSFDGSSIESSVLFDTFVIRADAPVKELRFAVTNISAPDIARRASKERFIVYALADENTPRRIIAQDEIDMMPLAEGALSGIDTTADFKSLPDFSATVHRVYPGGSTWVEVYEGSFSEGTRGENVGGTFEASGHDFSVPVTRLDFKNFRDEVQPRRAGPKTLVLRTSSPFPGESIAEGGVVLDFLTISIGNTLRVNSMITEMGGAPAQ